MKHRNMRLQFFAEPAGGTGEGGNGTGGQAASQNTAAGNQTASQQGAAAPVIDYTKIQQMLDGTLAAKEDTALKAYFKQQGLSQQEAEQAMATFKAEKAKNQPDVAAMQTQLAAAQAEVQKARIESAAAMAAAGLGIDAKTIPYLLKMADLSQVMGQDGKINGETLKSALNKVMEDIPALKPQTAGSAGFIQVGAGGQGAASDTDAELDRIFGIRKKER